MSEKYQCKCHNFKEYKKRMLEMLEKKEKAVNKKKYMKAN